MLLTPEEFVEELAKVSPYRLVATEKARMIALVRDRDFALTTSLHEAVGGTAN